MYCTEWEIHIAETFLSSHYAAKGFYRAITDESLYNIQDHFIGASYNTIGTEGGRVRRHRFGRKQRNE